MILKKLVTGNGLVDAGLTYASARPFGTPRRLTLTIEGMLGRQPSRPKSARPKATRPKKHRRVLARAGLTRDQ